MGGLRRRGPLIAILGVSALAALAVVLLAVRQGGDRVGVSGSGAGADDCAQRPECVAQRFASGGPEKCDLVAPETLIALTGAADDRTARDTCRRNVERVGLRGDVRVLEREPAGGAVRVEVLRDGREGVMTLERRGGRWVIVSFDE